MLPLENEFNFYLQNQEDLVKIFNGRVLAIKSGKVLGDYDSTIEAVTDCRKIHPLGTFLVQKCSSGDKDYTVRIFTPRVTFKKGSRF